MTKKLRYGAVWLANLNPTRGVLPGKTRPVLIVQHQALLDAGHPSTLIIPLTSLLVEDAQPLRLRLKVNRELKKDSGLLMDQVRAINNERFLGESLMQCDDAFMRKVAEALYEVMGFGLSA